MNSVMVLTILKTYLFSNSHIQKLDIEFLDSVYKNICQLPYWNSIIMEDE